MMSIRIWVCDRLPKLTEGFFYHIVMVHTRKRGKTAQVSIRIRTLYD
jgi:hypothetical protein